MAIFEERYDVMYYSPCSTENCDKSYIGESAQRSNKMLNDHNCGDLDSHFFKNSIEIAFNSSLINASKSSKNVIRKVIVR